MVQSQIKEIENLTRRLVNHEPVWAEGLELIKNASDTRDPSLLPTLRLALSAAIDYERRSQALSEGTSTHFKNEVPGGWIVEAMPIYAKKIVSSLRSAIERCTPEGATVVYEP